MCSSKYSEVSVGLEMMAKFGCIYVYIYIYIRFSIVMCYPFIVSHVFLSTLSLTIITEVHLGCSSSPRSASETGHYFKFYFGNNKEKCSFTVFPVGTSSVLTFNKILLYLFCESLSLIPAPDLELQPQDQGGFCNSIAILICDLSFDVDLEFQITHNNQTNK